MKKVKLIMPLEKAIGNRAHLVKVMTQVQGRTGQYQAHRWINPNKAMNILKEELSKQGLKNTDNLTFENPSNGKTLNEQELLDQMAKENFKGTLQEYVKTYKIKSKGSNSKAGSKINASESPKDKMTSADYKIAVYGKITKFEANTIYRAMKEGNLYTLPETIKGLYDEAKIPVSITTRERYTQNTWYYDSIYNATRNILDGNYDKAQEQIDSLETKEIELASKRNPYFKYMDDNTRQIQVKDVLAAKYKDNPELLEEKLKELKTASKLTTDDLPTVNDEAGQEKRLYYLEKYNDEIDYIEEKGASEDYLEILDKAKEIFLNYTDSDLWVDAASQWVPNMEELVEFSYDYPYEIIEDNTGDQETNYADLRGRQEDVALANNLRETLNNKINKELNDLKGNDEDIAEFITSLDYEGNKYPNIFKDVDMDRLNSGVDAYYEYNNPKILTEIFPTIENNIAAMLKNINENLKDSNELIKYKETIESKPWYKNLEVIETLNNLKSNVDSNIPYVITGDIVKELDEKLSVLNNSSNKGKGYIKSNERTDAENSLRIANEKLNIHLSSKSESQEKAELELDMNSFYNALKNGNITLSQAINNPQFERCAYLFIMALMEDDVEEEIDDYLRQLI